MRKRPVRDRLWPALAVCVLAALSWYAVSVSPYRIPWIVEAVSAKLTLLHVEKIGSQFHETGISVLEDGQVYSFHNDRRLFQYRFPVHTGSAVLALDNTTRRAAFTLAEELANADTTPVVPLIPRTRKAAMFAPGTDMSWLSPLKTGLHRHQNYSACFGPLNLPFRQRNSREMKKTYALDFVTTPWQD